MKKKYSIKALVDIDQLRIVFENFTKATEFTTSLVSYPEQELLITTGWRDICTKFHRACPASAKCCEKSDYDLTHRLNGLKELCIKRCGNGLMGAATPIVIRGVHIASLATGQLLLAKPDIKFFERVAQKYGYDRQKYLAALAKVPVVSERRLENVLAFLSGVAVQIAEEGLSRLQIQERTSELRHANAALGKKEASIRTLNDNLPNGIIYQLVRGTNGRAWFEFIGAGIERIYGVSVASALADPQNVFATIHPSDAPRLFEAGEKAARELRLLDIEGRVITPSGEVRWLHWRSTPRRLENGDTLSEGIATDITERKRATEALHASEAQFHSVSSAAQDAVVVMDAKGAISFWNDAASRMFGYTEQEALGRDLHKLIAPSCYYPAHHQAMAEFRTTGQGNAIGGIVELKALRKHGQEFPVELSLGSIRQGEHWHAVGIIRDITGRKAAEEALKRANRALLAIKECTAALSRASDEAGLLYQVCKIVVEIVGAEMSWVVLVENGKLKCVHSAVRGGRSPDFTNKLKQAWAKAPDELRPIFAAIRNRKIAVCRHPLNKQGISFWAKRAAANRLAAMIALPLAWENRCLGALSIFSAQVGAFNEEEVGLFTQLAGDLTHGLITLRARAEHDQLHKELLKISEHAKQIIAQELHDGLCQHLAGTAMMSKLLQKRLAEKGNPNAQYAKEICDLLSTAVDEARNLSHGLHPVKDEPDGLMDALDVMAGNVTKLFHLRCSFRCPSPVLIESETTATHLFRIAQESVNNAIKHGQATRVAIRLRSTEAGVALSIRDNGIGVPHDVPDTGMGIKSMRHRASTIGAALTVRRTGKQGTLVECLLPR